MYKVFSGEKCIMISGRKILRDEKNSKVIEFKSAEELHREYKAFAKQTRVKKLIVIGDEVIIWKVFRSLFAYIESSGGVVRNDRGSLLMIYRNRHWDLPKGKIEKGEASDQTALREVEEECGVKNLRITSELMLTHHIFFQDKHEWIKRTYWYEMTCCDNTKPKPQTEEGILKVEWMSKDEVKKVWSKIYPSLREVLTAASF
ncbi:MAG: NUDIX domain-containing protein [Bacteroidetes bacterium]|nr:NUDIX domain-containing protein [Bacteroidota bacterium]